MKIFANRKTTAKIVLLALAGLSLVSCNANATEVTTTFKAEDATLAANAGFSVGNNDADDATKGTNGIVNEYDDDENIIGEYVRLSTSYVTQEVADSLTFSFTSSSDGKASISLFMASPKSNPDANWLTATKASDLINITENSTSVDVTQFDTLIGALYQGAETLSWQECKFDMTLASGTNTVAISTNTNYPVTYNGMTFYMADSPCIEKMTVTTTATITAITSSSSAA